MKSEIHAGVDLVIPVYGEAPFLRQTMDSCESLESFPVEIIWILDRATMSTQRQIEQFVGNNKNSNLIVSLKPGIVHALNLGIMSGKSKYIARLDSDDVMAPDRLGIQARFLDSVSEVGVLGSQMSLISDKNEKIGLTKYPRENQNIISMLEFQNCIGHPSVMFRRSVFEKVGGYNEFFTGAEDYDLWIRMAKLTKLHNLDEPLTSYRISSFQFTKSKASNQGVVETAVRLASHGYKIVAGQDEIISHTDLVKSNKSNFTSVKSENPDLYKKLRSISILNKAYAIKSKRGRYTKGIGLALLALLISPKSILRYISIKKEPLNVIFGPRSG